MASGQFLTAKLMRSNNQTPWGFRLQGGAEFQIPLSMVKVAEGSLAEQAGVQVGDIILKINGKECDKMRHKEAQDCILDAGNYLELYLERGPMATWQPTVTPVGGSIDLINRNNKSQSVEPQTFTKTSLAKNQMDDYSSGGIGSGHNVAPKPFNAPKLVHKQFNSPINLYSEKSLEETLNAHTQVLSSGVPGINFMRPDAPINKDSAVFQMVQEEEMRKAKGISGSPEKNGYHQQDPTTSDVGGAGTGGPIKHVSAPSGGPSPQRQQQDERNRNICAHCERLIVGVFCRINNKSFHAECFVCATCGSSLKNIGYFQINDKLYCDIHARQIRQVLGGGSGGVGPGGGGFADSGGLGGAYPSAAAGGSSIGSGFPTAAAPAPGTNFNRQFSPPSLNPYPMPPSSTMNGFQSTTNQSTTSSNFSSSIAATAATAPKKFSPVAPPTAPKPFSPPPQQQQQNRNSMMVDLPSTYNFQTQEQTTTRSTVNQNYGAPTSPQLSSNLSQQQQQQQQNPVPNFVSLSLGRPQQQQQQNRPKSCYSSFAPSNAYSVSTFEQTTRTTTNYPSSVGGVIKPSPQPPLSSIKTNLPQNYPLKTATTFASSTQTTYAMPQQQQPSGQPQFNSLSAAAAPGVAPASGGIGGGAFGPGPGTTAPGYGPAPGVGGGRSIPITQSVQTNSSFGKQTSMTDSRSAPKRGKGFLQSQLTGGVIPFCGYCSQPIRGQYIMALNKTWCPNHFICANTLCKSSLEQNGFVEEQGRLYCENCYDQHFAPTCNKCALRIKGDCLNALDKKWHPECFTCTHCRKPFGNSSFYLEDSYPYCEKDWNDLFTTKCVACSLPIAAGDRWVEALNQNYHSNCFRCTVCHNNLEGQSFFAKGGRPFCKAHAR